MSSSRSHRAIRPVVTATTACSGLRPVAKALGWGESMRYTRGFGMPARRAISPTAWCRSGASASDTGTAPAAFTASTSLFQYEAPLMTTPNTRPIAAPPTPPRR